MEPLELGPCRAISHDGDPDRCVVLLPGQFYPTRSPVLWYAREAAAALGWSAIEVLGEPGEHRDALGWERECAERALDAASASRVCVIGKSLASLLASEVNDRRLPAIWLTPLLTSQTVIDALGSAREPTLLAGGTADAMWQREVIPANPMIDVVEFENGDHSLQVPRDPSASLDALRRLTHSISDWFELRLRS